MRRHFLKGALLSLLLAALTLPLGGFASAQEEIPERIDFQVPPQVLEAVPEDDLIELLYQTLVWKSGELTANLQAADEVLTPLMVDVRAVMGPQASLPDIASISRDFQAGLEAVRQSATLAEALQRADAVLDVARRARAQAEGLAGQFEPVEGDLKDLGARLESTVNEEMELRAAQLEEHLRGELEEQAQARVEELKGLLNDEAQDLVASLIASGGDMASIQEQVASLVEERSAELPAQVQQELESVAATAEAQARAELDQYLADTFGGDMETLERIRDGFQNVDQRIRDSAESKLEQIVGPARDAALAKRRQIIQRVVDRSFSQAEATIRSYQGAVDRARAEGRDVPDLDALIADQEADKATLVDNLSTLDTEAGFAEAVAFYTAAWETRSRELEQLQFQAGQEIVDSIKTKLAAMDIKAKRLAALDTVEKGIEALEQASGSRALEPAEQRQLRKLRLVRPELLACLELLGEAEAAQPTDSMDDLLDLVDRLQAKLDAVERTVTKDSVAAGLGIFIEAENETATDLLPYSASWHSHKELNAAWRPAPSGGGNWYLSRNGETLIYEFEVPAANDYTLFVRDFSSSDWPPGYRSFRIHIDGQDLGRFQENGIRAPYPPGAFGWHATATATLEAGSHVLEFTKEGPPNAGPLLDALYLTIDPEDNPEFFAELSR